MNIVFYLVNYLVVYINFSLVYVMVELLLT